MFFIIYCKVLTFTVQLNTKKKYIQIYNSIIVEKKYQFLHNIVSSILKKFLVCMAQSNKKNASDYCSLLYTHLF